MSHPFGDLIRQHLSRKHGLSQNKLAEAADLDPAIISAMCRGKRLAGPYVRERVLVIVRGLHRDQALTSLEEANALLTAAGLARLSADQPEEAALIQLLSEKISSEPMSASQTPIAKALVWLGKVTDGWSSEKTLRAIAWTGVWLLGWQLTFPLLHWPFASPGEVVKVVSIYIAGTLVLPPLIGLFARTKDDEFWRQQPLRAQRLARLFTYLGAFLGFHLGYMGIFAGTLVGYYFDVHRLPTLLEGLAATGPVFLAYACGGKVLLNQKRAYGTLRFTEGDGTMFLVFFLFGPLWGLFFRFFYEWLLLRVVGLPLLLGAVAGLAGLTLWQRRRTGSSIIPAHIWTLLFGSPVVLLLATVASLLPTAIGVGLLTMIVALLAWQRIHFTLVGLFGFLIVALLLLLCLQANLWVGRAIAPIIFMAWWRWGKKLIWFPLGFWGVLIAGATITQLTQQWAWSQTQAALVFSIITLTLLWREWQARTRPNFSTASTI